MDKVQSSLEFLLKQQSCEDLIDDIISEQIRKKTSERLKNVIDGLSVEELTSLKDLWIKRRQNSFFKDARNSIADETSDLAKEMLEPRTISVPPIKNVRKDKRKA